MASASGKRITATRSGRSGRESALDRTPALLKGSGDRSRADADAALVQLPAMAQEALDHRVRLEHGDGVWNGWDQATHELIGERDRYSRGQLLQLGSLQIADEQDGVMRPADRRDRQPVDGLSAQLRIQIGR